MATQNCAIDSLGICEIDSPFNMSVSDGDCIANYVSDDDFIRLNIHQKGKESTDNNPTFVELAGPRKKIYFSPKNVNAAIVTCGGLAPGLNNVIRALFFTLCHGYNVENIYGVKYGYRGLLPNSSPMIKLNCEIVENINSLGGTIIGTSRGNGEKTVEIVDTLQKNGINILFVVGGDGSQKGAEAISSEAKKRGYILSVIGIPKTIDNDLEYVDKTFGFETAVEKSCKIIKAAHAEAKSVYNGIGLVKLMGRDSGFIAAHAALSSNDVNYVFIPEVPFKFEGENGFLINLKKRLEEKTHAIIVIAEGAGQEHFEKDGMKITYDASGNKRMDDIGIYFREKISIYLKNSGIEHKIIYIDPSYYIRAVAANSPDSILCARLAQNAAHAAMAGKTGMVISQLYSQFVHLPISMVTHKRKTISPDGSLWSDVVHSTGQKYLFL